MTAVGGFIPSRNDAPRDRARDIAGDSARDVPRDRVRDASGPNDETSESKRSAARGTAQFSALLALLADAGTRASSDVLKQPSAGDAWLLDRLLSDAEGQTAAPVSEVEAGLPSRSNDALASALAGSSAGLSQAASDAMRYGLIANTNSSTSASAPAAVARAESRAAMRATVNAILRGSQPGTSDAGSADARTASDTLLARAGTDAAARFAAFAAGTIAATPAAASNAAATDVNTPTRDAGALVPEFRSRFARVVERMKSEYGHDVSLVETTRTQERQDFLFEQGRTRPGPVVTWTHNSAHTRGEAADVIVDGSFNNATGFARLQRIAREEGLRTLGITDPGHLELPKSLRQAESMLGGAASVSARIERASAGSAGQATVSGVASVAGVAGVASVAGVAEQGTALRTNGAISQSAYTLAGSVGQKSDGQTTDHNSDGDRDGSQAGRRDMRKIATARPTATDAAATSAYTVQGNTIGARDNHRVDAVVAPAGADATARATGAQDLRESTPGSISRLSLSVDGVDGNDARVTIDLRGKSVSTHIATDGATADALRARTGELQDALGRHGLEADTVRISTARNDSGDGARTLSTERDALKLGAAQQGSAGDGATSNGQRERAPAREWDKQEDARRARDEQKEQDARRRGHGRNLNENTR